MKLDREVIDFGSQVTLAGSSTDVARAIAKSADSCAL
jgi:hypothetical protein